MKIETRIGTEVKPALLHNYFDALVNQVYKILPMREHESKTLDRYIRRLTAEVVGGAEFYPHLTEDAYYAALLNILQYLSGHCQEESVEKTKQLVFEGIRVCEKLRDRYADVAGKKLPRKLKGDRNG